MIAIKKDAPHIVNGIVFSGKNRMHGEPTLRMSGDSMSVVNIDNRYFDKEHTFRYWNRLLRPLRRMFTDYEFRIIKNGPHQPIYPDWSAYWNSPQSMKQKRSRVMNNSTIGILPFIRNEKYIEKALKEAYHGGTG